MPPGNEYNVHGHYLAEGLEWVPQWMCKGSLRGTHLVGNPAVAAQRIHRQHHQGIIIISIIANIIAINEFLRPRIVRILTFCFSTTKVDSDNSANVCNVM